MRNWLLIAIIASMASASFLTPAFAQTCLDLGNCPVTSTPLEWMIYPFTLIIGDWIYVIVWGSILAFTYVKTENAMLTALVGVLVFVAFLGTSTYIGSSTSQVFYWGLMLVSVAIGAAAFYLIWTKSRQP